MVRERRTGPTVALQLRDGILAHLAREGLSPGARIPTEQQLCATFGSSRPSVREALKLLEQDGVIRVEHGRGRFLTAAGALHVERPITTFESITDMARHLGYELTNKVLSVQEERPEPRVAQALRLEPGETAIRLERLRLLGREPVVYGLDRVRRDAVDDRVFEVDWSGSLLDVLEGYGGRPRMSTASVRAEMLPGEAIERHALHDFGPALVIEETAFTDGGLPVLHAVDWHRGSHFAFSLLRRQPQGS
jgi:GntR family transcriptional regulator